MLFLLRKLSFKHALVHIKWWLLYGLAMSLVNLWGRPFYYALGFMVICLLMALIFYALLSIYWHVAAAYRPLLYVAVMIAMQWLLFVLVDKGLPRVGITLANAGQSGNFGKFLFFGLNVFFDIVLAVIAYIKHVKAIRALNRQLELQRELHLKELERINIKNQMLERELQMHKSESARWVTTMNAHMVGNAHNAIYRLLLSNDKVADGFLGLKSMYDYVLENAPGQSGMVPLQREIRMLDAWTRVFKLGYESAIVAISVAPDLPPISLPSFTFIVFIENAFEHGYHADVNHPILIRIDCDQRFVRFRIDNKKPPTANRSRLKADRPSGLGIEGVKQRLKLAGIPFDLAVDDDEERGVYSIILAIDYIN